MQSGSQKSIMAFMHSPNAVSTPAKKHPVPHRGVQGEVQEKGARESVPVALDPQHPSSEVRCLSAVDVNQKECSQAATQEGQQLIDMTSDCEGDMQGRAQAQEVQITDKSALECGAAQNCRRASTEVAAAPKSSVHESDIMHDKTAGSVREASQGSLCRQPSQPRGTDAPEEGCGCAQAASRSAHPEPSGELEGAVKCQCQSHSSSGVGVEDRAGDLAGEPLAQHRVPNTEGAPQTTKPAATGAASGQGAAHSTCLLYTSPSPRD